MKFQLDTTKNEKFPHRPPLYKLPTFVTSCLWGSMGKLFVFCRIQLKFRLWSYKKRWHISWKFQFELKRNIKVIAQKPLTNVYEIAIHVVGFLEIVIDNRVTLVDISYLKLAYSCFYIIWVYRVQIRCMTSLNHFRSLVI